MYLMKIATYAPDRPIVLLLVAMQSRWEILRGSRRTNV